MTNFNTTVRQTSHWFFYVLLVAGLLVQQGCSILEQRYEAPSVTLSSLRAVPSGGALPSFEIGLHVVNPNPEALKLRGVVYTISLEGHDLIKGAGSDLPVIEGYGEGDVTLTASASLLSGLGLVTDLMNRGRDSVSYEFEARLDVGAFWPDIRVSDSGTINLRTSTRR